MEILLRENASEQHGFVVAESGARLGGQVTVLFLIPAQTHLVARLQGQNAWQDGVAVA